MVRKFELVSKSKLFRIAHPKQLSTAFLTVLTTLFQQTDNGLTAVILFQLNAGSVFGVFTKSLTLNLILIVYSYRRPLLPI